MKWLASRLMISLVASHLKARHVVRSYRATSEFAVPDTLFRAMPWARADKVVANRDIDLI